MSRHLVDPELVAGIDGPLTQAITDETLPQYRVMLEQMVAAIPKPTSEALRNVRCDVRRIPGPAGSPDVSVLVYAPGNRCDAALPAILHIHGGGMVSGSAAMSDPNSRAYAVEMNCVVVSVNYRLAPETRFPGRLKIVTPRCCGCIAQQMNWASIRTASWWLAKVLGQGLPLRCACSPVIAER